MRIGIAGLGRMGTAVAERLKEVGHDITVWNRSAEKAKPLIEAGARAAGSPRELAEVSEFILTILTDADAIQAVYLAQNGLLAGDAQGKVFIEMSTVQPHTQIQLAEAVRAHGASLVECPVGGTTGPARSGKLLGLAAGDSADVARARPVLDQLCRRVEHVGPIGAGASLKLAINLPLLLFYQAFSEAYSLCQHLGLDPNWLVELFSETTGGTNLLKLRGPAVAKALAGGETGPATFDVDLIRKDLRTMLAEARSRGFELPIVERTLEIYDEASRAGWGARDSSSLAGYWSGRTAGQPSV